MAEIGRSAFDFTDQYGSDPVMRRYDRVTPYDIRGAELDARIAAAERESARAKFESAQAELTAKMAPMKMASDSIAAMSNMLKQQSAMQEQAAVQRGAAAIAEGLGKATDFDSVIALGNANLLGLRDDVVGPQWRNSVLSGFRQATDNAQSIVDVDSVYAKLPAAIAAEPEMKSVYDAAKNQAALRQTLREKYAATGTAIGEIPTTPTGTIDITQAGLALAAYGGEEQRKKEARAEAEKRIDNIRQSYGVVTKRLAETPIGAEPDPQLKALQQSLESQLIDYSRSLIPGAGMPPPKTGDTGKGKGKGRDWTTELIPPGVTVPPARTPAGAGADATAPAPTPTPTPTEATATPTTQPNAAPVPKTKTAAELRAAQKKIDTLTGELDAMKAASGLAKQPWGIRQINEALSSENAAIRAKAEELRQAQMDLNPMANADENNAQDVAAALELVYPKVGGNDLNPKFDVGNPKDSRVMAAAMFLQKVRPEFLKMVASDPGVNRGNLRFTDIDDIVRNQPNVTGKRTTRK